MKVFEVSTPDGRRLRHQHESLEAAQKAMLPGYAVTGEVFGADLLDNRGGYVRPIGGKSLLAVLIEHHADELLTWLRDNGFQQTVHKKAA